MQISITRALVFIWTLSLAIWALNLGQGHTVLPFDQGSHLPALTKEMNIQKLVQKFQVVLNFGQWLKLNIVLIIIQYSLMHISKVTIPL